VRYIETTGNFRAAPRISENSRPDCRTRAHRAVIPNRIGALDVHETPNPAAKQLTLNAAVLMTVGLATGGFVSAAMTGKVDADVHSALASHLNALLGCFWMVAVAYSMPMLRYGPLGAKRLVWLTTVPNFANWIITIGKAFLKVPGVDATGQGKNDLIFGLLTAFVVLPSMVAVAAWVYGFFGRGER
jgi:hydroxylaminobenzene mutase